MEYRTTMENGGEYTRSSNGHGLPSWSLWDLGNWCSASPPAPSSSPSCSIATAATTTTACSPFSDPRSLVPDGDHHGALLQQQYHHMTCLKLGKRNYFGDVIDGGGAGFAVAPALSTKRERSLGTAAPSSFHSPPMPPTSSAAVPRCQVDGCKKSLVDEKEYHKRHKVCEMHSKAPKVVVLGAEQRFCQQCSRFHVISEFDDSKRSCRRRLAGHNERRRKSSSHESFVRNPSLESTMAGGRGPYFTASSGRALSLLSSEDSPWVSASDISSRSSAALRELIAENRAAAIAGQLFTDRSSLHSIGGAIDNSNLWLHQPQAAAAAAQQSCQQNNNGWSNYQETSNHVTLDLMQMPSSLEFLSGSGKSKEDEECCDIWKSLAGTHVV